MNTLQQRQEESIAHVCATTCDLTILSICFSLPYFLISFMGRSLSTTATVQLFRVCLLFFYCCPTILVGYIRRNPLPVCQKLKKSREAAHRYNNNCLGQTKISRPYLLETTTTSASLWIDFALPQEVPPLLVYFLQLRLSSSSSN